MRVVKLKKGYRITCSDTEMDLMRFLLAQGQQEMANDDSWPEDRVERRIYTSERWQLNAGPLVTDDDRRDA